MLCFEFAIAFLQQCGGRELRSCALILSGLQFALAACGAAEIMIQPAAAPATGPEETLAIARAAQNGSQVIALPVTRISVLPVSTASQSAAGMVAARPDPSRAAAAGDAQDKISVSAETAVSTIIGRDARQYRVAMTPTETGLVQDTFRVTPRNDFTSRNVLRIIRFGNTDIASVVENEFTDLTVLRIQQAGQVAAAIASVAAAAATPPAQPRTSASCLGRPVLAAFSVMVQDLMPTGSFQPVPGQEGCFEYQVRSAMSSAVDTVPRTEFRQLFVEREQMARVWPTPACHNIIFIVRRTNADEVLSTPLRIADPFMLRLLPLPQKGKIMFDPICNANLTNDAGDVWKTRTAVVEELSKQIQAGGSGWK